MSFNGMVAARKIRCVSDALLGCSVVVRPTRTTFEETIARLVNQLIAGGLLPARLASAAVGHIGEREAIASTAMVDIGISIPHARLEGIDGIIAAMAVSDTAVYDVADGVPITIVTLVLSSPELTGEHLTFLSTVSMLLQSERVRGELRGATSVEQVLRVIRNHEGAG
jgi:mannitol/fructose-specific phosphotransferase system IIA component (Ntr-type)